MKVKSYDVLGIPIAAVTLQLVKDRIEEWAKDQKGRYVCVRDVPALMVSINNPDLIALHKEAEMVTPDGMPLAIIGKLMGYSVERTCGADLLDLVCSQSPASGLKHYFYGGKTGVAKELAEVFRNKYPGIKIVGYESPPFRPLNSEEDAAVVDRIKESQADVVWMGISSPKQDIWMRDHYKLLPQTLIGVGAAFDFHTGLVNRAPKWMQKNCLEWLYRLISEPKRLWRRYLVLAPKFLFLVTLQALASQIRKAN